MDEREFEQMLGQVMKHDFSAGSEAFRDALLERCLEELASDDTQVAVSGALSQWDYVITSASKPVEAGSQVRLTEN